MTRDIAKLDKWNVDALDQRATDLSRLAVEIWPWEDFGEDSNGDRASLRWRLNEGTWQSEVHASDMVLNIVASLISLDEANAEKMFGPSKFYDLQSADNHPPDVKLGSYTFRGVPDHPEYTIYPHADNMPKCAERCKDLTSRCGASLEMEFPEELSRMFWNFLKKHTGGVPGQKAIWRGPFQKTQTLNRHKDVIRFQIGDPDQIRMFVRATSTRNNLERSTRMMNYSVLIEQEMGDQISGDDAEQLCHQGRSISIFKAWDQEDVESWLEPAIWLTDQAERLKRIVQDNE